MAQAIRLEVLGAGSATLSVSLVRDICLTDSPAGSPVVLMDVGRERVEIMHRCATRYADGFGAEVRFECRGAATFRAAEVRGNDGQGMSSTANCRDGDIASEECYGCKA